MPFSSYFSPLYLLGFVNAFRPNFLRVFGVLCCFTLVFLGITPANAGPVSVRDDVGHTVQLSHPAQRIVSLAPHVTELLFDTGAGAQVIAVSDFSDYPAAARALPSVGGSQALDLERITVLKPDLVIAWQSGNSAGQVEAIERMGIPVFRSEPKSLEDVATSLERFGILTGHADEGGKYAASFRQRVEALRLQYGQNQGSSAIRVFYQVWNQPLMTVGGPHLISRIMELCGGQNIFVSINALSPVVDAEAVIAANPQLMVVSGEHEAKTIPPDSLKMWQNWQQIAAVRNRDYLVLDPALITRHTPRILNGAEQLCKTIERIRRTSRQSP